MTDKITTTIITSSAAGVGLGSKIDLEVIKPRKSWLDIPVFDYETANFIAEITARDILMPLGIAIALIGVGLKVYEKVKSNGD